MEAAALLNQDEKIEFGAALSEVADAEMIACHVGYKNDVLVTQDHARHRNGFALGPDCRAALSENYGVIFKTLEAFASDIN